MSDISGGWWRDAVIYQIYTRSFLDTDGDGVGDLEGVITKLDYLRELGVDALWLSPLHPTPNIDYGYDGTDYYGVAPEMGTLETFDRLVSEAKARGLRIIMDLVMDYTSTAHPWFVQARSSRASPFHDWYVWRDGPPDRPPNDWPAFFSSGSAWTFDVSTRRWYLHYFTEEQPELNWANPDLRSAMHDVMRFWLSRGVAGFRLDVISFLSKPDDFGDLPEPARSAPGRYYANGPRLHEYLREIRREVLDDFPETLALGEGFGLQSNQALDFVTPERRELDLLFLFDISALTFAESGDRQRPAPADIRATLQHWDQMMAPAGAWPTLFLGNHDVARMVDRFGDIRPQYRAASAKLLATLLLTLRGTPVLYQGDEIGMANAPFADISEFRDVAVLNAWRIAAAEKRDLSALLDRMTRTGRDTGRTPVQWNAQRNAGFTVGDPWIKLNPDYLTVNIDDQRGTPGSVLEYYRTLLRLRRGWDVLRQGDLVFLETMHSHIFAYERRLGAQSVLVILNWSDEECVYETADAEAYVALAASHGDVRQQGNTHLLRPFEAMILVRRIDELVAAR
jgi:oligo-1,6-glucosidase